MPAPRLAMALAAASVGAYAAGPTAQLRVLRVSPAGELVSPAAIVTVTFDRPVAGRLDRTIDPASIVGIEPAVVGRFDWRDPVTIRFTPASSFRQDTPYTLTVANTFEAMDGTRLPEPYRHRFRVPGPRVLAGLPVSAVIEPKHLAPDEPFALVLSAPVDPDVFRTMARLELDRTCPGGPRVVRIRVRRQREVTDDDPYILRYAGPWQRSREARLRRVVEFEPAQPLPRACAGNLVLPSRFDREGAAALTRWSFHTYGDFRIVKTWCGPPYRQPDVCPTGPITVEFSTPVRGAELARGLRMLPELPVHLSDTTDERDRWRLDVALDPRRTYGLVVDLALTDVFGQRFTGNPAAAITTTGYAPALSHPYGRLLVEREGYRTLAVSHVNVDTLLVAIAGVPRAMEPLVLMRPWGWGDIWDDLPAPTVRRLAVDAPLDQPVVTGVRLPGFNARRADNPTLLAVKISSPRLDTREELGRFIALAQVTDLAVHAKIGATTGAVWVTGAGDGLPRPGTLVTLHDRTGSGRASATTGGDGLAALTGFAVDTSERSGFEGYVTATLGSDRAVVAINQYDADLGPWRFGAYGAFDHDRYPAAAAVFTERDIYRPGERVFAKAIVRSGPLGALGAVPGDSVRWRFSDREQGTLRDTVTTLSSFGTAAEALELPVDLPLGTYAVAVEAVQDGHWRPLASARYRIAEYRPPEFLVQVAADTAAKFPQDVLRADIEARYLFGAPMGRAAVTWVAQLAGLGTGPDLPGTAGYYVGKAAGWWDEEDVPAVTTLGSGTDTLDLGGRGHVAVTLSAPSAGKPARAIVQATVTDVNRQSVSATAAVTVHPAAFYVAAKPASDRYFWRAGTPETVHAFTVRPNGERVTGVRVDAAIVRREWHRVRRTRGGISQTVGEWVTDTVSTCRLTTAPDPVACTFTPPGGGTYVVHLTARDGAGREARTSFYRWATGPDWVPWFDEDEFKMDVVTDRERYTIGDTATVLFASPFTDAEAWVTVEREGVIAQRRLRITNGSFTLTFPITEAYAPNAFVSIVVVRGRSAPPGELDDPGRPTLRVGYVELTVSPEDKRLAVTLNARRPEYRPGDTAQVDIRVRDARGVGRYSEVTLWAVDEGVLALTGYRTPDPIALLYRARGLGMRLASNLVAVAEQVVQDSAARERTKGRLDLGGGGGGDLSDILRSRFQTTAFFLASVVTDSAGRATASAPLPDNLTTFRLMAVAVTPGDRYGSGESSLLVTRPLVARPALPRFVRPGDAFEAGVVVNHRLGGTPTVAVQARAAGATLEGARDKTATLDPGRGTEVRFRFRGRPTPGDTAVFRFAVRGGGEADAVQRTVPLQPDFYPRAFTVAGMLRDTATARFLLPATIDPERSRLHVRLGTSPLSVVAALGRRLRVYPYWCSEQIASAALPLVALYRAHQRAPDAVPLEPGSEPAIREAVRILARRQSPDGGIGLWSAGDWSTPWLSAYAGLLLLEARDAGFVVDDSVLVRLAGFLRQALNRDAPLATPVAGWWQTGGAWDGERIAALDYLSRYGRRDRAAENRMLQRAAQLPWEDRVRLAEILARGGSRREARNLLEPVWASLTVDGTKALPPDQAWHPFYFSSRVRPIARLVTATLVVDSTHAMLGPLVETLVDQVRTHRERWLTTQDLASAALALVAFDRHLAGTPPRGFRVRVGNRTLFEIAADAAPELDSSRTLAGLLRDGPREQLALDVGLEARGTGGPIYYYLTVHEIPTSQPVRPADEGIAVERWYERYTDGRPATGVAAGDLVRVRLRITVPRERHFVVLDDPLPAGLEAVDLSLRTTGALPDPGPEVEEREAETQWQYGSWEAGQWSPFDHRELRDDRVVYAATVLWAGVWDVSYVARATTPGTFVRPPAQAEEMYNPAVHGRSDGGSFTVTGPTGGR